MELHGNFGCISSETPMVASCQKRTWSAGRKSYRYSQRAYVPQVVVLKDLLLIGPDCVKALPVFLLLWRWQ